MVSSCFTTREVPASAPALIFSMVAAPPAAAASKPVDRTVTGFHARVVQHEVDHLDGVLYPMRIRDLRNFGFTAGLFPNAGIAED